MTGPTDSRFSKLPSVDKLLRTAEAATLIDTFGETRQWRHAEDVFGEMKIKEKEE